jgi:hypothetical protein
VPRASDEADLDVQPIGAQQPREHCSEVRPGAKHDHPARSDERIHIGGVGDVVDG